MKNYSKGFTLIELLVVIAIIGILSGIVLSSLSNARTKAFDAKVKGQLSNIRNAAELYYATNYNYGPSTGNTNGCATGSLTGMFADTASGLNRLSQSANYPAGENTILCYSNGTAWAVSDNFSTANSYWCVDSTGASRAVTTALTAGQVACPAS